MEKPRTKIKQNTSIQVVANQSSAWCPPKGHTFLNKPDANTKQQKM